MEEIGAAGNAASFVRKQMQNLAGNLCFQKETNKQKKNTPKSVKMTAQKWLKTDGFLEMNCSRLHAEYFERLGKQRRRIFVHEVRNGEHSACVLNPCHKSMSG